MTIAVTGSTGQLGRLAIAALTARGVTPIALARNPDKAADLGVEARAFDYKATATLAPALQGVTTLVLISSNDFDDRVGQHRNVIAAAQAAGVSVVCAGVIHSACHVHKVHPYRLDAFSSGDAGPLGWVSAGQVRWSATRSKDDAPSDIDFSKGLLDTDVNQWPLVDVVLSHAGASRRVVDALVQSGVAGLVVAASGNGTVHHAVQAALEDAQRQGVQVRSSTRCQEGRIVGKHLAWPDMAGLSPLKARISLMLALHHKTAL